ncbi:MAG: hypothetical protein ACYSTX_02615 [Planctomycetota bacterium]|jgi:hypothetical protein
MKVKRKLLIVMTLSVLVLVGCENKKPDTPSATSQISLEKGAICTVQFRRDALGAGSELPVPPMMGVINGAEVNFSGIFSHMNEDWVVLIDSNKSEIWIPRNVILLIKVN